MYVFNTISKLGHNAVNPVNNIWKEGMAKSMVDNNIEHEEPSYVKHTTDTYS